jgi:hypothetical protein
MSAFEDHVHELSEAAKQAFDAPDGIQYDRKEVDFADMWQKISCDEREALASKLTSGGDADINLDLHKGGGGTGYLVMYVEDNKTMNPFKNDFYKLTIVDPFKGCKLGYK